MARIICVANQKGGVGKTTTSVNLAAALVELGHRVMIVDMDPQGNASSGLGVKRYVNQENNVYQVLIGEKPIRETIQNTNVANLDIIPANPDLVGAEIELVDMPNREYRLRSCLAEVSDQYKYILIDCPPSLGLLTVNSLSAAETFLVPLQCEYYALEGLSQLLNTAGLIKKSLNQELRIEGIVLTMFDARNNLSHQVVAEIQSHFGEKVFQSIIPRNVRLSEAPSHGQTIFQYDPKSLGAKRYRELAQELDHRVYGTVSPAPSIGHAATTASEAAAMPPNSAKEAPTTTDVKTAFVRTTESAIPVSADSVRTTESAVPVSADFVRTSSEASGIEGHPEAQMNSSPEFSSAEIEMADVDRANSDSSELSSPSSPPEIDPVERALAEFDSETDDLEIEITSESSLSSSRDTDVAPGSHSAPEANRESAPEGDAHV